jgi:hypothetical protein
MAFRSWLDSVRSASRRSSFRRSRLNLSRNWPHTPRLFIEPLEIRWLPSTVTWTGAGGDNNWNTGVNWSTGAVPGTSDDAVISTSGITVTHSASVADAVHSLASQAALNITGGSLLMDAASSIIDRLTLSGGTLAVAGNLAVSGPMTWTDGALAGGGSLTALGGLEIDSTGTHQVLDGLTLNNGTAAQPDTAAINVSGPLPVRDGAVFDNPAGASVTLNVPPGNYGGLYWDGSGAAPSFINDGAMVLGTEGGRGQLLLPLVNHGSITAQTGTLELGIIYGSVSGPAVVTSGSIVGQPGTLLNFYYNGLSATAGSSIQADRLDFGSFAQVAGSYSASGSTEIDGGASFTGTVASLGNLQVGGGTADFSPASGGPLALTVSSLSLNGNLSGTDSFLIGGPFTWVGGTLAGPQGSSLTPQGGIAIQGNDILSGRTLINAGSVSWLNSGTFSILNGGVLNNLPTGTFGSAGNASTLALNGGTLAGAGTVNANVSNSGQVNPGGTGAPGALAINGSYSQSGSGVLNIELGGPTAGSQFDQLNVTGNTSLGGTLNISLLPNLGHVCGVSFPILNAGSVSGTFSSINGLSQPGGMTITPTYSASRLTLTAPRFATTTAVAASVNPSILNQSVTFTATISAPAGVTDVPTGAVQFQVDSVNVGSPVPLSGLQASFSLSSLPVGPHTITMLYSGDSCFYASSASLSQNVLYTFSGFLPPLAQLAKYAIGRNVDIKFQLSDYHNSAITNLSAVTALQIFNSQNVDVLGGSGAAGAGVSGKTYAYSWQTKGLAAGSYTISLTLADGTTHTITIQLTSPGNSGKLQSDSSGAGGQTTVGGLLGGDIALYVDNSNGAMTGDELARIADAVGVVDATLAPYAVTITVVGDATQANVTLNMDATSALGGYADGVLGCTTDTGQITLLTGWNWYASADTVSIGAGQYDFQTVVRNGA